MHEVQNLKQIRDEMEENTAGLGVVDRETAVKDLRFLCSRLGLGLLNNVKHFSLHNSESKKLCDFLVIGQDVAQHKTVSFPTSDINVDDPNMFVAVVVYNNGTVRDAYLFPCTEFKKPGFFSMFNNKKGVCSISVSKEDKLKDYSFGHVIGKIGK